MLRRIEILYALPSAGNDQVYNEASCVLKELLSMKVLTQSPYQKKMNSFHFK